MVPFVSVDLAETISPERELSNPEPYRGAGPACQLMWHCGLGWGIFEYCCVLGSADLSMCCPVMRVCRCVGVEGQGQLESLKL